MSQPQEPTSPPAGQPDGAKATELSALGEFGLIDRLTRDFPPLHPETRVGIGDDCAVLAPPAGQETVVTTDLLLEGVHFDLTYFPLMHLGYKAVIVNLSDVYAMNAQPRQITVSLGISKRFSAEQLDELYAGILQACREYEVDLVGGDTSASLTGLCISITAIGYAPREKLVYRGGAKPNELICVTGNLGAAYVGLLLLEREKRVMLANPEGKPQLDGYRYVLGRMLRPEARRDAVEHLQVAGIVPTAMMDVSDGLSSELLHLTKASGVGCRVYPERIPIDRETMRVCDEMGMDPILAAMNGGEDYELLFTVPMELQERVDELGVSIIGYTTEAEGQALMVTASGQEIPIVAQGWNAFREGEA
ncbi:MAG: thiamine-phosphate kinase [Bacteroidia bacterium]|nr:MAG: thiamine-phosphate kinase [Bacteroidia bacterium]